MRNALSIVLAGLLVTLPLEQVLAQAQQQRATTPEASLVQVQGVRPVLRVPALAPEARPRRSPGWSDWSNGKRTLAVVISVTVVALVVNAIADRGRLDLSFLIPPGFSN